MSRSSTAGQGLQNVDFRLGAALETLLKLLEDVKVFDIVFIDADWENQGQYFDWASDAEGTPEVEEWSLVATVKKAVEAEVVVDATLIPTLSTHKAASDHLVDGFVFAIKK
ncbi:S-adenosyl-L-methionine-dependent methyltransferase [Teratosphaeria destructans]|uniref:S-adenosyl-L-methionine-dependent methyltransferase n=1 Tax=Teratosphaeria destructans TaxID=418781 RepID=A0A9W7SN68_9PEZI|nr:S-adenosyl-L-methionine-dependent methyltransferase [Teratosphaeria destructans]